MIDHYHYKSHANCQSRFSITINLFSLHPHWNLTP
jgi:hypothetical protein